MLLKLVPATSHGKMFDPLYEAYRRHGESFDFLVGKFADISFEETQHANNLVKISSYDVLKDFKKLLDNARGRAFTTDINIYTFLLNRGYPLNADRSITLREPYSMYDVLGGSGSTITYPNKDLPGTLTKNNIQSIYKHFFQGKSVNNNDPDRSEEYGLTSLAIVIYGKKFHKSKSKTLATYENIVMSIGDKLTTEQQNFIEGLSY